MDLGRIGIWSSDLRNADEAAAIDAARELEALGYGALWFPNGKGGPLERSRALLAATERVTIVTGILSIWDQPATDVAAAYHSLNRDFGGRFVLGLGVSHGRDKTYDAMVSFLDGLDSAPEPVTAGQLILAALGPRMLRLARDRAAGAHPYNGPVSHTRRAREILGAGPLLAPEAAVILDEDPARARDIARQRMGFYLNAPNYVNNFLREGFTPDDVANGGSDRLIDSFIGWGDTAAVLARIQAHFDAGADHVAIQVLPQTRGEFPLAQWRALAPLLVGTP
jgi:probable F420-dependent oxidoreductase